MNQKTAIINIGLVSPQLDRFKWKSQSVANCRCPICGDSQRNKKKARGFFFPKKNDYFFKCHNCGAGHNMHRFLEAVAPALARDYSLERWRNGENGKSNYVKPDEAEIALPKADLRLPRITSLDADHPARVYMEARKIPDLNRFYFAHSFGDWVRSIDPQYTGVPNEERIVIPFVNKSGELVAAQGRALTGSGIRYITVKFKKDGRAVYGEDRLDYSRRVYAVEGPLDAAFLPNAIALAGGDNADINRVVSKDKAIFVFDNEPRNPDTIRRIEKAIDAGYQVSFFPDNVQSKDVNDMVTKEGFTIEEISGIIYRNAVSGLAAKLKLATWRKV